MDIVTLKHSICKVAECDSGNYLLEETDPHATLRQVNICDIPTGSLIIKMDGTKFLNLLKENKLWGFNKHSDYLIVTDIDLVFIEMKSRKDVNDVVVEECRQKFTSDSCSISEPSKRLLTFKPTCLHIERATLSLSPVRIFVVTPYSLRALIASAVDSLGGSRKAR